MLAQAAGVVGGLFLTRRYLRDRLEEVKEKMEVERVAKDVLQRRFRQSQEDSSYTVLALLPTLSEQVLQTMDVEALTKELQSRSRGRTAALNSSFPGPSHPTQSEPQKESRPSSLTSSVDIINANVNPVEDSQALPASQQSTNHRESASSNMSDSFLSASGSVSQSWIEPSARSAPHSLSPGPSASSRSSVAESISENGQSEHRSEAGSVTEHEPLAESIISNVTTDTASSVTSDSSETRTKAQLWNEVKMLTFTRTLTTVYSSTLLCLFTTLQLTFLARSKYVAALIQQEQDERMREQLEAELSPSNLVFGTLGLGASTSSTLEKLLSGGALGDDEDEKENEGTRRPAVISEEVESMYLTLSWWLLHVGWKDVGERVRRAVEEAFDGVSLKTKLAAIDLHRLISDVRRRVEHEITFEGTERRTDFISSLLPPTPETIHHVLTQGGYTPPTYLHQSQYPTAIESSQSLDSSQLSYNFVDSPALAISNAHPQGPFNPHTSAYVPPQPQPPYSHILDEPFASLITETREVLSSANFARVLEVALDQATDVLFDSLENNVFKPSGSVSAEESNEDVRIRLAGLLPGLAKWSQLALDGLPNELVDKILCLRETSCLSAIVFARFEEQFQ